MKTVAGELKSTVKEGAEMCVSFRKLVDHMVHVYGMGVTCSMFSILPLTASLCGFAPVICASNTFADVATYYLRLSGNRVALFIRMVQPSNKSGLVTTIKKTFDTHHGRECGVTAYSNSFYSAEFKLQQFGF